MFILILFLMRENQKIVDAFKNELEILYMYAVDGVMSEKDIAGILTGRECDKFILSKGEKIITIYLGVMVKNY